MSIVVAAVSVVIGHNLSPNWHDDKSCASVQQQYYCVRHAAAAAAAAAATAWFSHTLY